MATLGLEQALSAARIELQKAQVVLDQRPQEALEHLLAACRLDPESSEIALNLGRLELRLGKYSDALESLNRVLALDETSDEALGLSALCHSKLRNFDKALARARAALELAPRNPTAGEVLSDCLRAQGAWADAIKEIQDLVLLEGLSERAKARLSLKLAQCYLELGAHSQAWEITQNLLRQGYAGRQIKAIHRACETLNKAEMRAAFGKPGLVQRVLLWAANRHILRAVSLGRRRGAAQSSFQMPVQTGQGSKGEPA